MAFCPLPCCWKLGEIFGCYTKINKDGIIPYSYRAISFGTSQKEHPRHTFEMLDSNLIFAFQFLNLFLWDSIALTFITWSSLGSLVVMVGFANQEKLCIDIIQKLWLERLPTKVSELVEKLLWILWTLGETCIGRGRRSRILDASHEASLFLQTEILLDLTKFMGDCDVVREVRFPASRSDCVDTLGEWCDRRDVAGSLGLCGVLRTAHEGLLQVCKGGFGLFDKRQETVFAADREDLLRHGEKSTVPLVTDGALSKLRVEWNRAHDNVRASNVIDVLRVVDVDPGPEKEVDDALLEDARRDMVTLSRFNGIAIGLGGV